MKKFNKKPEKIKWIKIKNKKDYQLESGGRGLGGAGGRQGREAQCNTVS